MGISERKNELKINSKKLLQTCSEAYITLRMALNLELC
jgi:hypothetical protein